MNLKFTILITTLTEVKILVSILSVVVLFLSTQCMIAGSNLGLDGIMKKESSCSKKKTCSKSVRPGCSKSAKPGCSKPVKPTCSKKQNNDQEKGCKDACNPFMACCGCLYDCSPKNDVVINKPFVASVKNGYKNIYFPLTFTSGVWQPPEFVI